MTETPTNDQAFDLVEAEARIARTARMLDEDAPLQPNQRKDIVDRFSRFIAEYGYTQKAVARELDMSSTTVSEVLRQKYAGKSTDR